MSKTIVPANLICNPNDEKAIEAGYYYDPVYPERVIWFIENFICHIKGEVKPFILEPWQREIIQKIYGWRRPDGRRRFKTVWFEIGRGNGKSKLTFALGLYHLIADRVNSAEVYYYAANAGLGTQLFEEVLNTVQASDDLRMILKNYKRELRFEKTNSVFRVSNAESSNSHGTNPSCIIVDEVHTLADNKVLEGLLTGLNKRGTAAQPLILYATTAGYPETVYEDLHDYAESVQTGVAFDLHYLPLIYAVPQDQDWREEKNWYLANPNLGVSIDLETMREDCEKAKVSMSDQVSFRRLHLNQILQKENKWINLSYWDECCKQTFPANFAGCMTCAAADMSASQDMTSVVYTHYDPNTEFIYAEPHFYLPSETVLDLGHKNHDKYLRYQQMGLLTVINGKTIKHRIVLEDILEKHKQYNIKEIALDPWQAVLIAEDLEANKIKTVRFNQSPGWWTPPMIYVNDAIANKTLVHDGNEILRWMANNIIAESSAKGLMPAKPSEHEKIDGIAAMIMSVDRVIRNKSEIKPQAVSYQGVIFLDD